MAKLLHFHVAVLITFLSFIQCIILSSPARGEGPATAPAAGAATTQPVPSFGGEWQTSFGPMTLSQTGDAIQGSYGAAPARATIAGKLKDRRFTFTYTEPSAAGEGWFELAEDGQSFKGKWRENCTQNWGDWEGQLTMAADSFAGLWTTSYGRMRLRQSGNSVHGVYEFGEVSHVTGTVASRVLHVRYEEPNGDFGEADLTLAADGATFTGTWKATRSHQPGVPTAGEWTGRRIRPIPNLTWLVVLEANWEHGLQEQEYSFGLMLRTFFARAPMVQVRQRFFGNEADFRRWCGELPFLAEPVVLLISSHGTRDGIQCGNHVLGADVLIDCLRDAGNLRLLHFGSCMVAGGDIPKKIFQALGKGATFPISDYVNAADWGGSAVVDFTYLDLVLTRGLNPADAVVQTRKMVTFARENGEAGDAISGAGLILLDPKNAPATQPVTRKAK